MFTFATAKEPYHIKYPTYENKELRLAPDNIAGLITARHRGGLARPNGIPDLLAPLFRSERVPDTGVDKRPPIGSLGGGITWRIPYDDRRPDKRYLYPALRPDRQGAGGHQRLMGLPGMVQDIDRGTRRAACRRDRVAHRLPGRRGAELFLSSLA